MSGALHPQPSPARAGATPRAGGAGPAALGGANLTALKLALALVVAASHALILRAPDAYLDWRRVLDSEAAVQCFFMLSGGLVLASYARHGDAWRFWRRRISRIMPAYALAVLAFAMLALVSAALQGRVAAPGEAMRYLAANLATLNFLEPGIAGIFAANPLPAINGALWSIKVELAFYALVPLIAWACRRAGAGVVLAALVAVGVLWWPGLNWVTALLGETAGPSLRHQMPGQLAFFAIGAALMQTLGGQMRPAMLLGLLGLAELGFLATGQWPLVGRVSLLAGLILAATLLPRLPAGRGGADISFGLYLSHFPICQLLIENGAGRWPVLWYMLGAIGLSALWGAASWRWVERPALDRAAKAERGGRKGGMARGAVAPSVRKPVPRA